MDKRQLLSIVQSCLAECKVEVHSALAEVDSVFFISLLEEELGISLPDDFIDTTCPDPDSLVIQLSNYLGLN